MEILDDQKIQQKANDALTQYNKLKEASPEYQDYAALRKRNDWFYKDTSRCGANRWVTSDGTPVKSYLLAGLKKSANEDGGKPLVEAIMLSGKFGAFSAARQ